MKKVIFYLNIIILFIIIINFIIFIRNNKQNFNVSCLIDNKYLLIEKNIVFDKYTSYLYKDNNDVFISKIYDNNTFAEVTINDLIKSDKIQEYEEKIQELLYLKYPKFIVSELLKDNTNRTYLFRTNELIIYFSNYHINPDINELLYLKVNYNEIKEYLDYTVIIENSYENEDGYNYTNAKKSVAITFDDSPNGDKTTRLLQILNDNKAHATFFVVGNKINRYKDILINMKNLGNEIGSHTYEHSNMSRMSDEEVINDYNLVNNLYKNIFKEDIKLLRPPYGSYKTHQKTLLNTSFIMWSMDTNDWRHHNSDYLVSYVLDHIKDGDIILFHDSYNTTIEAVNKLLPILYSNGYQVMSVSELFNLRGKPLENNKIYSKVY